MQFDFIKYRRIPYIFSAGLVGACLVLIAVLGLKWSIDFTGGSVLSLEYESPAPSAQEIQRVISDMGLSPVIVQKETDKKVILKLPYINEQTHQQILSRLQETAKIQTGSEQFETIGPVIGKELKSKIKVVVVLSLLAILVYIIIAFGRVSFPVKSSIYGLMGTIALFHDVTIPLGVWALLGKYAGYEVSIPVITALLTVFGYSINDTVVVFDRIRENLIKNRGEDFGVIVNKSLNDTLVRSVNTSLTVLIVLLFLFFLGGSTLKPFSLALIIGIGFGTYSSIFLASPLVYSFYKIKNRKNNKK